MSNANFFAWVAVLGLLAATVGAGLGVLFGNTITIVILSTAAGILIGLIGGRILTHFRYRSPRR